MDTPDEENLPGMTVRWGVLVKIQGWGLQIEGGCVYTARFHNARTARRSLWERSVAANQTPRWIN